MLKFYNHVSLGMTGELIQMYSKITLKKLMQTYIKLVYSWDVNSECGPCTYGPLASLLLVNRQQ